MELVNENKKIFEQSVVPGDEIQNFNIPEQLSIHRIEYVLWKKGAAARRKVNIIASSGQDARILLNRSIPKDAKLQLENHQERAGTVEAISPSMKVRIFKMLQNDAQVKTLLEAEEETKTGVLK